MNVHVTYVFNLCMYVVHNIKKVKKNNKQQKQTNKQKKTNCDYLHIISPQMQRTVLRTFDITE